MLLAAACGAGNDMETAQPDYDQTKKMVVDILKTDDGKKAIQDIMNDENMKQEIVMDQAAVTKTIEQSLTSKKAQDFWTKSLQDPKFAEAMAKSMKKQHEELLKSLMKDPEYQKMMIGIMKDPAVQKELAEGFKSQEFREHLQGVVRETIESPLYQAKIQDMLMKAAKEQKDKQKKGKEQGGGE
jgi:spore germination protein D